MGIECNDPLMRAMLVSFALALHHVPEGPLPEKYEAGVQEAATYLGWSVQVLKDLILLTYNSMSHKELVIEYEKARTVYGQELPQTLH